MTIPNNEILFGIVALGILATQGVILRRWRHRRRVEQGSDSWHTPEAFEHRPILQNLLMAKFPSLNSILPVSMHVDPIYRPRQFMGGHRYWLLPLSRKLPADRRQVLQDENAPATESEPNSEVNSQLAELG